MFRIFTKVYIYANSMENYQKLGSDNRLKLCDMIQERHYTIRTEYGHVNWIRKITLCYFSKKSMGILNTQVQGSGFTPARPECIGTGGVQG